MLVMLNRTTINSSVFTILLVVIILFSVEQGHHHLPETRGLCLSEEQTVSTVRTVPNT